MKATITVEIVKEEGFNCPRDEVLLALEEQLNLDDISLEAPNGSESTYTVTLVSVE